MAGISSKAAGKLENKRKYAANELQSGEFSDGTGLEFYDFNARIYDQQIGRFLQIDPLADQEKQEAWTPYHYCFNNPVLQTDPDGKNPITIARALWQAYRIYRTVKLAKELTTPSTIIPSKEVVTSMVIVLDANGNAIAIPEAQANKLGLKPGQVVKAETLENIEQHGGGKNAQHSNQKAREIAKEKYETARKELDQLKSTPNKTKEIKEQIEKMEKNVKHLKSKMDNTGENHSMRAKGS